MIDISVLDRLNAPSAEERLAELRATRAGAQESLPSRREVEARERT